MLVCVRGTERPLPERYCLASLGSGFLVYFDNQRIDAALVIKLTLALINRQVSMDTWENSAHVGGPLSPRDTKCHRVRLGPTVLS